MSHWDRFLLGHFLQKETVPMEKNNYFAKRNGPNEKRNDLFAKKEKKC